MRISVDWQRQDEILIATLIGRVDSTNADEFQKMMEAEIAPKDRVLIMDFEQVSYISSAGLRVMVIMAKKFKGPYKRFGVCALSDPIRKIFKMSGLERAIPVIGTRTDAIAELEQHEVEEVKKKEVKIEVKEAVDYVIVRDNIEDITNFTLEKYEFTNDTVLSDEIRRVATTRIKTVLWQEIERLRHHRKMLLEKMFKDAEKTLDDIVAGN